MRRVLVVGRVRREGLACLEGRPDLAVEVLEEPSATELRDAAATASGILVRTQRIDAALIEASGRLEVVSRHGVGFDNVDVAALTARRIPLALAVTANMIAVAEHAFYMMLELVKRGRAFDRSVRAGDWESRDRLAPGELAGKRLLLVGLGRVGRQLAARAGAFEMSVAAYDPHVSPAVLKAAGAIPVAGLMTGLADADVVSLHLPLTAATRGLIGEAQLRAMRDGAILVNTARGGLVDERALARALREGRIRGAALDVFEAEPPGAEHPLFGLENALLTPHVAGTTGEAMVRMAVEAAENVVAALDGRLDPAACANPEVLAR